MFTLSTTGRTAKSSGPQTRASLPGAAWVAALLALLTFPGPLLHAQENAPVQAAVGTEDDETPQHSVDEVALEKCDRLPMVKVEADGAEMHFLLDSAASSLANLKSFSSVKSRKARIASWTGTTETGAGEVSIAELAIAGHRLLGVRLSAVDLSAIGRACGHTIDGIFGVDLIQQMGLTIDLKHQVGLLPGTAVDAKTNYAEMEKQMGECDAAFDRGSAGDLAECFERDVVLYTSAGEFRGRERVMEYLQARYLRFAPNLDYKMEVHEVRLFGDALWYSYDYSIDTPQEHPRGHGMAMCLRSGGRWRIVNMQDSEFEPEPQP